MTFVVGEASSFFPSSSSSSSSVPRVFLSFRGEDSRKGFTDHLYAALERKGIVTFMDDKDLEKGQAISKELLKAIEESMFAIIILSPNYASSTWCLDELQKIVECSNNLGLQVIPIFHGVEPSDVRHQRGSYKEAFRRHREKFGHHSDKVERWRNALKQVTNYSGWDSKDRHEAALVEIIALHIHKKLISKLPSCTDNLVGIASKVKEVKRLIGMGSNDVRFIGIWGMGGIGKTTIARAVHESIQDNFEVSCFLANVRELSETNGLVHIQRELASNLNIRSDFHNLYDGKKTIRNSLCNQAALLVLDDVSEIIQLESLAGNQDWFGPGSRVIITTRDRHLLIIHEVHEIYEVGGLVQTEALRLFCLKAFKRDRPEEGYLDLCREVVKYSGGLPLALEILGSFLYGRTVDVWHSAVKKIKSIPQAKILDTLKISYDVLDSTEKNIFLDVACFFKGMNRNSVSKILENFGYYSSIGIELLIERSLITVERGSDKLEMHDLLQEMGRNIVLNESPNDPGKRSRLWSKKDIDLIFINNMGTEAIQSIILSPSKPYVARWSSDVFSKTSQLKFLSLCRVQPPIGLNCLPSSLKVLHWIGCPLKALPFGNQPYEVVEIKLCFSRIEKLWPGKMFLGKLKYMDLSYSRNLKRLPDLSAVPNLETLDLRHCSLLTEVHPSLVHHKSLVLINLDSCRSLKTLPSKLQMSSLKELILNNCSRFEHLPEFGESMKHLSMLSLKGTAIRKLPTSLGCLVGLSELNLENCKILVFLPESIHRLQSLKILNASGCSNLCRFPEDLMKCLEELCATEASALSFVGGKGTPTGLRLPLSVSKLPFLSSLDLSYCSLSEESFPDNFCQFPSLADLNLSGNNFVRVPVSIHKLSKLRYLYLNHCPKLQFLPKLPSKLRELEACNCDSLKTFELNPLKTCNVFESPGQDRGQIFSMLITGCKIPSWFDHQEEGSYVSVPHNCPLSERVGISLCFLFLTSEARYDPIECSLAGHKGNTSITWKLLRPMKRGFHLYILCLNNDDFSNEIHQESHFRLFHRSKESSYATLRKKGGIHKHSGFSGQQLNYDFQVVSSGARLVHKQDIEDLNKSAEQMQQESAIVEADTVGS